MIPTIQEIDAFIAKAQKMIDDHFTKNLPKLTSGKLSTEYGKKYCRVVLSNTAFCFIDLSNGDILKPASWKTPAKHARGNIRSETLQVGPYGPAYLR